MNRFITLDRDTDYLFPPSMSDWLPDDHLARFVVEVVDQLDLSTLTEQYVGKGIVWPAQTDGGTGIRHHQARDGF